MFSHKIRLWLRLLLHPEPFKTTTSVVCTKERPWSGKTVPVMHMDADLVDDNRIYSCPNCGYIWDIGPDV